MKKIVLFTLVMLFVVASSAFAYRPFFTEDAEIVGDKVFQNEVAVDQMTWKSKDADTIYSDTVYYGFTKNIHASLTIPYAYHKVNNGDTYSGQSDLFLVGKYVLLRDAKDVARVAIKVTGKWDNGDYNKVLGFGDKEYAALLCFTQPVFENLLVHAHGGYTIVTDKKNPNYENYWLYAVGADLIVTQKGHLIAELVANKNLDSTLQQQRFINAGMYYVISDHWNVDLTYRYGLTNTTQDYGFGAGIGFHF